MCPGTSGDGKPVEQASSSSIGLGAKCKSLKVQQDSNDLWQANLKLQKHQLRVMEKWAVQDKHLIGMMETLTEVMGRMHFMSGASHGVGGGRSMVKGKEKEKAIEEEPIEEEMSEYDPVY